MNRDSLKKISLRDVPKLDTSNIEIMRPPWWESNEIKHGQTCQAVVNCKWWKYQSSPWEDVHQQYATLEIERCKEIDRDKLIVHRKQRQSSKAFIKAAQSENKKSENKKVKNRKEGKGSSTARKYCNSCGLDDSFKSEILGKSWQNFSRNYNNQRQPKSAKSKGKQTEQAVGANITRVNFTTTTKLQGQHTGYATNKHFPDSNKIEFRLSVNQNSANVSSVNRNSANVSSEKRTKKVQKRVAQSCDLTGTRTRVTSFEDYRYTAGTQNQTPVLRKGEMPDSMTRHNSI